MDGNFQVVMALDKVREAQWHQNAMLEAIAHNQLRNFDLLTELLNRKNGTAYMPQPQFQPSVSEPSKWSGFFKTLANNGVQTATQWLVGLLAMAYISKGGDALTLLQAILKTF